MTAAFERQDPDRWTATLAYRHRSLLPYDGAAYRDLRLMPDTTVYVDARKARRFPGALSDRLRRGPLLHSAVAMSELATGLGLLDPAHSDTPRVRAAIAKTLRGVEPESVVAPSPDAWVEAALVSGILARTQGFAGMDRRRLLNDALMVISAAEAGAVLVTRNRRDMDLLLRFRPDARVWLYEDMSAPRA